jgi:adenosylmethionine-8-amino-7-oxononanoate aminotransferase
MSRDWYAAGLPHAWRPYTQMKTAAPPLPVVSAKGVRLTLADGRELVDGVASWWTACHGYGHPHIAAAVRKQLDLLPHVMFGGLTHEPALTLARRLAALLPGDLNHVFFAESGSVAVEVALKIALQFWLNHGVSGRTRFVSFLGGYHGDTLGAMSLCDPEEGMHRELKGALLEQHVVPLPCNRGQQAEFERFLAGRRAELAGVVVEPLLQGAGGMKFHDPAVLAFLRGACDRHGLLLIADEIATGFGRTGTMFACEQAGVVPDLMCLSKALTGGTLPLSATVASARIYDAFLGDEATQALMHGPTFMANPLACAAANASLDLFETEPRLASVRQLEAQLSDELEPCRGLPGVVDVRVRGACGVVQLERPSGAEIEALRARFVDEGVWIRPFGDVVYLMPAFVIAPEDLSRLTGAVVRVVREWSSRCGRSAPSLERR